MSDYRLGGKGKKAPYQTTHYRIPTGIKATVEKLSTAYKVLIQNEDSIPHLLEQVNIAIDESTYLAAGLEDTEPTNDDSVHQSKLEAAEELVSKWKRSSKATRDWTKANALLKELEALLLI